MTAPPLPVTRVADVDASVAQRPWLIQSLWAALAVGLIGGQPKSGKTWLALDFALSVASGTPSLGTFPVHDPGPVLLYLAEDSLESARTRIEGLCTERGLRLRHLDLYLLTTPSLRLDRQDDVDRLFATVAKHKPRLLVLDPLVRLHRSNENDAGEISAILGQLRLLQRTHDTAVVLVHHARKNGRGLPGQDLRGSGDLHAWGDSNAYLGRRKDRLLLTVEQRFHRPIDPVALRIQARPDGSCPHLALADPQDTRPAAPPALHQAIVEALAAESTPVPRTRLRTRLHINNHRLGAALQELQRLGRVHQTKQGWVLDSTPPAQAPLFRSGQ
ncbi:MAG: AAA family ATPase [Actinomycetota bacterium]